MRKERTFTAMLFGLPALSAMAIGVGLHHLLARPARGQVEGASDAIQAAAAHGWEAALLAVIMCAILSLFAGVIYWMRVDSKAREEQAYQRELRLSERVTELEQMIHSRDEADKQLQIDMLQVASRREEAQLAAFQANTTTVAEVAAVLKTFQHGRLCLADDEVIHTFIQRRQKQLEQLEKGRQTDGERDS